ncbi:MAG TPA: glycoside hydrolase family 32 protein [Puia sp.]|nr:glycoside hydrolase family 32 protein [Puia sp.]
MTRLFLPISILAFCAVHAQEPAYREKYRPQFHFSPPVNWTNDPNGLTYYKGQYHLFYQYNPYGNRWGHMSWGHAVSADLIHWKNLPVAIPEGNGTMIFSGSAVVDDYNSSGFPAEPGEKPMIAIYTGHFIPDANNPDNYLQSQQLAFSSDGGNVWTKYKNNPVLDQHKKDFRDPCVFWYAPQKKWIMAVVLPQQHIVQIYSSPNLINWTWQSDFGPAGDMGEIWECPSLVEVPVEGSKTEKKWVLLNSQQITMQYFVGEFDGTKFVNENPDKKIFRPDYGPDYYAGITYNHLPAGHPPILLGWANNWKYANDIPTFPWKSMMALPRELSLKKINGEWILCEKPVSAIYSLRENPWKASHLKVSGENSLSVHSRQCEIEVNWKPAKETVSGIYLARGKNQKLVIGYDEKEQSLFMDRQNANDTSFNKNFDELTGYATRMELKNNNLHLHIFFDHSVVEVFANDGCTVMTMQIFSEESNNGISLYSEGGSNLFDDIKVWNLKSAWLAK